MKTKFFLLIVVAAVLCACEEQIGNASLIEGAWDLQKAEYGQIVSADLTGQTHLKDEPYTHVYESKEQTWLFRDNHISWWEYYEYKGDSFWSPWVGDGSTSYTIEGEGKQLTIVACSVSTIPGEEHTPYYTRYEVRKLTSKEMVLHFDDQVYVSDLEKTVNVSTTYYFQRENTLLDFIQQYWTE